MTDEKQTTENEAIKPKTVAKKKSASKPKVSAEIKAEAKADAQKSTVAADTAPYLKHSAQPASTNSASPKGSILTSVVLLSIVAALAVTTAYKFNEERNAKPVSEQAETQTPAETQETILIAPAESVPELQAIDENTSIEIQLVAQNDQPAAITIEESTQPVASAIQSSTMQTETSAQMNNDRTSLQQRRDTYEKELQLRQQQFAKLMEARKKERTETIAKLKSEYQRIRESQVETRKKADEINKQIYELHEKLRLLMRDAHAKNRVQQ